jgi:hypothetical protein
MVMEALATPTGLPFRLNPVFISRRVLPNGLIIMMVLLSFKLMGRKWKELFSPPFSGGLKNILKLFF